MLLLISLIICSAVFYATAWGVSELCLYCTNNGPNYSILGITIWGSQLFVTRNFMLNLASKPALALVVLILISTLGTSLLLLVNLRQTLGRCRVRPLQVIRVASYAFLPASVLAPLGVLLLGIVPSMLVYNRDIAPIFQLFGILLIWFIFSHNLYMGLKYYLKLPRPRLLAFTSVFVGMLFTLTMTAFILVQSKGGF